MATVELSEFSPAFRYVAACMSALVNPRIEPGPVLAAAEREITDWGAVGRMIVRHRVELSVARVLRGAGWPGVPAELRRSLEQAERSVVLRSLSQMAQTDRVAARFLEAEVRFFMLKGPPLSVALFGSPTVRQSQDIDLIVDREDIPRAAAILVELGYERGHGDEPATGSARDLEKLMEIDHHFKFMHRQSATLLELHWQAVGHELYPLPVAKLWPSRETVRAHRVALPVLPHDVQMIYLACHGAKHAWFRLKWLLDIAAIVARDEPAVHDRVWRMARDGGVGALFGSSLLLAHGLLAAPVPRAILDAAERDRGARSLARFAIIALAGDGKLTSLTALRNQFGLRGDFAYRWSVFTRLLNRRLLRERESVPLPA